MKELILTTVFSLFFICSIFSQTITQDSLNKEIDSIVIGNRTKISMKEFHRNCHEVFMESFGNMTEEELQLFEGVSISVNSIEDEEQNETLPKDDKVIINGKRNKKIKKKPRK
jgi:hypothetical protein